MPCDYNGRKDYHFRVCMYMYVYMYVNRIINKSWRGRYLYMVRCIICGNIKSNIYVVAVSWVGQL